MVSLPGRTGEQTKAEIAGGQRDKASREKANTSFHLNTRAYKSLFLKYTSAMVERNTRRFRDIEYLLQEIESLKHCFTV